MNEYIVSIGIDPLVLLQVILVSLLVFILLYKKYVVSAFDPLVFFIVGMVADTSLMFSLPWERSLKWEYAFFALFVWIGFVLSARVPRVQQNLVFGKRELFDLEVVLVLLCVIIVVANLYLGISAGFPLFSSNPSAAKVMVYSGGVGLVRRINIGPYTFFCCGCVYLLAIGYKTKLFLCLIFISTVFIALSGAKSALLVLLTVQALVFAHSGLKKSRQIAKKINKYMLITCIGAVGVALTVTIKDQGSIILGLQALLQRILLTGDGILYYFGERERIMALTDRSLAGYWHYLTNDTLAMLRLADYDEPLGSVILGQGNNGFGPNAQSFLCADLFFGPVWGCLYSATIGYTMGFLRTSYFRAQRTSPLPIMYAFRLMLAVSAMYLFFEAELFLNAVIMTVIVVFPLCLVARLMPTRAKVSRAKVRRADPCLS
jgi:hypothetical protein